jgi:hypothetical protein
VQKTNSKVTKILLMQRLAEWILEKKQLHAVHKRFTLHPKIPRLKELGGSQL